MTPNFFANLFHNCDGEPVIESPRATLAEVLDELSDHMDGGAYRGCEYCGTVSMVAGVITFADMTADARVYEREQRAEYRGARRAQAVVTL